MYRYCINMLWDRSNVEDVLQTAILKAFNSFDKFTEGTNFKAWIFKFLTHTIFNFNKRHEKISTIEIKLEQDEVESIAEIFEQEIIYQDILNNPERLFEKVGDRLKNSLKKLNNIERSAFVLRAVDELTYKEIAVVLKIPVGTVMSHLSRARTKLRKLMCDYAKDMRLTDIYKDKE